MNDRARSPNDPISPPAPAQSRRAGAPEHLPHGSLGRSHRSKVGKARLQHAIELTRRVLRVPATHRIGIVPASDTGAVEMAMWSMLGPRPVTMLAWESFGEGWVTDVVKQLKLEAAVVTAPYGALPDLAAVDPASDVVFTWNGTTSGARVPDGDWISDAREGLTFCDATSAAFAQELPFEKLDVVTFSWQKVLGGEGAHGMLILGPRAVERLESHTPAWPLPKLFRMTKGGKLIEGIFQGDTINTPSMLAVEDYIFALEWAQGPRRASGADRACERNAAALDAGCRDAVDRASCGGSATGRIPALLKFRGGPGTRCGREARSWKRWRRSRGRRCRIRHRSYRDAPRGLNLVRATVETDDIEALALARLGLCRHAIAREHTQEQTMMPKVLISDQMDPKAAEIFRSRGVDVDERPGLSKDELKAIIGGYDGLAIRSATKVTADVLEAAGKLKVVGRAGIGVDNVDIPAATARGVVVMNTPFGNSITTAEHAIALMFALARDLPAADASTQAGKWEKNRFMGVELTSKTLGLIGAGNIGSIVAERAIGLRMKVIAYDPFLTPERAVALGVEKVELAELLARADFITLHTPLTEQTRNILSRENLAKAKKGVAIINCARGGLVDEAALKEMLESGHVAGAALDVFVRNLPRRTPCSARPASSRRRTSARQPPRRRSMSRSRSPNRWRISSSPAESPTP
jgi:phosphoserine aminotransferase